MSDHWEALDDLCPNSGASKGVCVCVSCSDTTASERRILIDLIAQLRDHCQQPSCNCDIGRAADYAETRLRRLSRDD